MAISLRDYANRVYGGWLGRIIGSAVGAPTEFRPYTYVRRKYGEISGHIRDMSKPLVNDDEMYEILALFALEECGINLTATDIVRQWADKLYTNMYTAEKAAWKNLKKGIMPPLSATNNNPWFDFIGAQMKGDIWGLICPGMPDRAAEYARMDGSIAHAGEGIHGEVWIATMVAMAFAEHKPESLIKKALDFVPKKSMFTQFVTESLAISKSIPNWREARKKILKLWNPYRKDLLSKTTDRRRRLILRSPAHRVHTIPNAGLITMGLIHGGADFGRTISILAMSSWDSDCNCGNAGTILGVITGAEKIPAKWRDPLNDDFFTKLKGFNHIKIVELARRTQAIGEKVIRKNQS